MSQCDALKYVNGNDLDFERDPLQLSLPELLSLDPGKFGNTKFSMKLEKNKENEPNDKEAEES